MTLVLLRKKWPNHWCPASVAFCLASLKRQMGWGDQTCILECCGNISDTLSQVLASAHCSDRYTYKKIHSKISYIGEKVWAWTD